MCHCRSTRPLEDGRCCQKRVLSISLAKENTESNHVWYWMTSIGWSGHLPLPSGLLTQRSCNAQLPTSGLLFRLNLRMILVSGRKVWSFCGSGNLFLKERVGLQQAMVGEVVRPAAGGGRHEGLQNPAAGASRIVIWASDSLRFSGADGSLSKGMTALFCSCYRCWSTSDITWTTTTTLAFRH